MESLVVVTLVICALISIESVLQPKQKQNEKPRMTVQGSHHRVTKVEKGQSLEDAGYPD